MKAEYDSGKIIFTLDDPTELKSMEWISKRYGVDHLIIFMRDLLARKLEEKRLDAMEHVKQLLHDDDVMNVLRSKGVDL